jgi:hypothetical protein
MTDIEALPHYDDDVLSEISAPDLISLLLGDEDRVARNVIDECARRGETMVSELRDVLVQDETWDEEGDNGYWWLRHHAVMILGLIPEESAGLLLVDYMRRIDEAVDDDLTDWLSGRWPALFLNKPATVIPALTALFDDRGLEWYTRHDALESVLALSQREGSAALDSALDWAAAAASDESDDWDLRMMAGNTVLNFAPERHRALMDKLAIQQKGMGVVFSTSDVSKIYATGGAEHQWASFADPWEFYTPEENERRQHDWAKQDTEPPETFTRPGPKIGRNDPCPCGSGKKYKKCCLPA